MFSFRKSSEEGQAMVEFALIIPLFMLIILATIELGWIGYQSNLFTRSYTHAAWDITAEQLSDMDPLTTSGSVNIYSGSIVKGLVADTMAESSLWGFNTSSLKVKSASAKMYNEESSFKVPDRIGGSTKDAATIKRYMVLEADLEYEIPPMTIIGKTLFGQMLKREKKFSCERIVGAQHRSE